MEMTIFHEVCSFSFKKAAFFSMRITEITIIKEASMDATMDNGFNNCIVVSIPHIF